MGRPNFSKIVVGKTNTIQLEEVKKEIAAFTAFNIHLTAKYVDELITKNNAAVVLIGNDTRSSQRENTLSLTQLNKSVKPLVGDFLTNINTSIILTKERKLALAKNLCLVSEDKSSSMKVNNMDMLNGFAANIAENTAELLKGGIPQASITALTTFANTYLSTATTQSGSLAVSRKMTAEENNELYAITEKVMDLCKVGQRIFRLVPEKAALFNYNKRARGFMGTRKKATTTDATPVVLND